MERVKKKMTKYLYKDKFLSGWGQAPSGSYVITDKPVKRPEFKLVGTGNYLSDFKFRRRAGQHFIEWVGVTDVNVGRPKKEYVLGFGKGKTLTRMTLRRSVKRARVKRK